MGHKITLWRVSVTFGTSWATLWACYDFNRRGRLLWWFNIAVNNNKSQLGLSVKPVLFLPDFNQILIRSTCFNKSCPPPTIKCHGNPSSERRKEGHGEANWRVPPPPK